MVFSGKVPENSVRRQTEYKIVQKLCEIFPHLDNIELHLKVNHYLDKRLTKVKSSSEKDLDVALAVNEISEAIANSETDALAVNEMSEAIANSDTDALAVNEMSEDNANTDFVPLRPDPASVRDKLFTGIDEEYNVTNMAVVFEVIEHLENRRSLPRRLLPTWLLPPEPRT